MLMIITPNAKNIPTQYWKRRHQFALLERHFLFRALNPCPPFFRRRFYEAQYTALSMLLSQGQYLNGLPRFINQTDQRPSIFLNYANAHIYSNKLRGRTHAHPDPSITLLPLRPSRSPSRRGVGPLRSGLARHHRDFHFEWGH